MSLGGRELPKCFVLGASIRGSLIFVSAIDSNNARWQLHKRFCRRKKKDSAEQQHPNGSFVYLEKFRAQLGDLIEISLQKGCLSSHDLIPGAPGKSVRTLQR